MQQSNPIPDGTTEQSTSKGSPYAANDDARVKSMLDEIGVADVEELFDIPESVRFEGEFGIDGATEQEVKREVGETLSKNADIVEFLGRGHYSHYVPSLVDHLSLRSEFITSYTQYQPEISQGFLQVLFEFQSIVSELTGMDIANCSMYDAATSLGEAVTLAHRVRDASGSEVLIPDYVREERVEVVKNYTQGVDIEIQRLQTTDGMIDPEALEQALTDETLLVYVENPTAEGVIEEHLTDVGELLAERETLFCVGSDLVALSLLQDPGEVGADVVVGNGAVLGLPKSYGMNMGIFACRDDFLRQIPGRLVGSSEDADGSRAYTLTLQTREQHIRRERATSNICSNQAWVALRAAIHAVSLGPEGLVSLADQCAEFPEQLAEKIDSIEGVSAPVHDAYHFRDFKAELDSDAAEVASELSEKGFAVHDLDEQTIQISVTEQNQHMTTEFATALAEVME